MSFLNEYFKSGKSSENEDKCFDSRFSQPISSLNLSLSSVDIIEKVKIIINFFTDSDHRDLKIRLNTTEKIKATPKSTLKSILTDYVVGDITINESSRIFIYILNILCRSFFGAFKQKTGEDYRLIYKGGNVTKLYFEDFVNNYFNNDLQAEIFTKYGNNFKNSDLDFTIENFNLNTKRTRDQQANYIIPIIWYILTIARIIILGNMQSLYDFCKINFPNMNNQMKNVVSQINRELKVFDQLDDVKFIGICFDKYVYLPHESLDQVQVQGQFEFIDVFSRSNQKKIEERGDIPKFFSEGNSMREDGLTINQYNPIDESTDVEVYSLNHFNDNLFNTNIFNDLFQQIVSDVLPDVYSQIFLSNSLRIHGTNNEFSLMRLMLNFEIIYSKDDRLGSIPASSELYDVTYITEVLASNIDLSPQFKFNNYNYNFIDTNGRIIDDDITIVSEFEVVNDLIEILFVLNVFPWNDSKYQKRLIRLIFLSRYIEEKTRVIPIPVRELDIDQFRMNNILEEYLPEIKKKIDQSPTSTMNERVSKQENEEEFAKLKRIIIDTQDDIDSYLERTKKRVNVNSSITRLTI